MNNDPIADGDAFPNRHIGIDEAIFADRTAGPDEHARKQCRAAADRDMVVQGDKRPNRYLPTERHMLPPRGQITDAKGGTLF